MSRLSFVKLALRKTAHGSQNSGTMHLPTALLLTLYHSHLNVLHESHWRLLFLMNLYASVTNLVTNCCPRKLFLTTVYQTMPHLVPGFLSFFQPHLHHWTQLKFSKSELPRTNLTNQTYDYTIPLPCCCLHLPKVLCFQYLSSYAASLRSIYCTAYAFPYKLPPKFTLLDFVLFS